MDSIEVLLLFVIAACYHNKNNIMSWGFFSAAVVSYILYLGERLWLK